MKQILIIIMVVLLLLCLADMPYGYFTLVRFMAAFLFGYMAYDFFEEEKNGLGWTFVALTLLFQPFFRFHLGRAVWNVVDVVVAIGLIAILIYEFRNRNRDEWFSEK